MRSPSRDFRSTFNKTPLAYTLNEMLVTIDLAGKENVDMKRVGFLMKVRQDRIDEYKNHHRKVWPEMLDALRRHGWRNYSLFMRQDGLMFGCMETPDSLQTALAGMAGEDVNSRWQEFMKPFFENLGGDRPDEAMIELKEVFHLD